MSNITMAIDEEILKRVRKLAVERNTTLTALVREYLEQLAAREDTRTEDRIDRLRKAFDAGNIEVGPVTWTREDLHAR
jgi:predicted transcriptional regulator